MAKGPAYDQLRAALHSQYAVLVAGLGRLDPAGPTDCAGWAVADLETHLALTARGLGRIAQEPGSGPPTGGGVEQWAARLPELAADLDERARGERLTLAGELPDLAAALEGRDGEQTVRQLTGTHRLADAVLFRVVEGVVHGLDAAIEPDPHALRLVTRALAQALADREPGSSVELRVPPYVAVQCVSGPRHTRGTPPNVVETDAVSWVRLATGRLSWADALRNGRVRASGERSDLGGFLPILR
ncbi:MAG TPA: sterol carrier family protein [Mycobacteriales bacterium]|nr:sterol carrier family protein [Mycobacteriales bacterium]